MARSSKKGEQMTHAEKQYLHMTAEQFSQTVDDGRVIDEMTGRILDRLSIKSRKQREAGAELVFLLLQNNSDLLSDDDQH